MRRGSRFDVALDREVAELSPADRRLAHEIAAGVLRARTELDRALAPLVSGRWQKTSDDLKDLLRIGAHQLLKLSRVPRYAAVQSTVDVAKRAHGPGAARLVNAVLRRLANAVNGKIPPPAADLAAKYSHPEWLVARWSARFGLERTEAILRHNNQRPPLTIQAVRWSEEDLLRAVSEGAVEHRRAAGGYGIVVKTRRVASLPGYAEGAFVVQDAGPARLLDHCGIPHGSLVWDACAAPGGKAALLSRRCRVLASEFRMRRLRKLRATLTRAAPEVALVAADARRPPLPDGKFGAVLLDVPCSATGVMARHPDARWRLEPKRIEQLAALQREILDGAASVVKQDGLLAYITCSLEREENEDQVEEFLERHDEFAREGDDLMLLPGAEGSDGGYAARLRRVS